MLVNNKWVNNEIVEEIKRYLKINEDKANKNLWERAKTIQDNLKKQEKFQIKNLTVCLKELEKE